MAVSVLHSFVNPKADGPDATIVRPSNWNDEHDVSGLGSAAEADTEDFLPSQLPLATTMPAVDGQLVIEATSDTLLTLKYRGSDGVIRAAELPLTDVPLVEPVLVWTTDEDDFSPLFTVTFEEAAVGDVLLLEVSALVDFSVIYSSESNTLDAAEVAAGTLTFSPTPDLAYGTTYYARVTMTRGV